MNFENVLPTSPAPVSCHIYQEPPAGTGVSQLHLKYFSGSERSKSPLPVLCRARGSKYRAALHLSFSSTYRGVYSPEPTSPTAGIHIHAVVRSSETAGALSGSAVVHDCRFRFRENVLGLPPFARLLETAASVTSWQVSCRVKSHTL